MPQEFQDGPSKIKAEYQVRLDYMKATPFQFLGEAIGWIISRGQPVDTATMAEAWDNAEQELFKVLDGSQVDVQGYPAPNRPKVYENIQGIWAKINERVVNDRKSEQTPIDLVHTDNPTFTPIDFSEGREDGGSVVVGNQRWDGVRVPTAFVLGHWPPADAPRDIAPSESRRVARADLKKALKRAIRYMEDNGHAELTRTEAEKHLLVELYSNSAREPIREIVADEIPARSKRRTRQQLSNRINELKDCRQFLKTAT